MARISRRATPMTSTLLRSLRRLRRFPAFERLRALAILLVFTASVATQSIHAATESHLPHHGAAGWGATDDHDRAEPADALEAGLQANDADDDHDPHPRAEHEKQINHDRGRARVVLAVFPLGGPRLPAPPDAVADRPARTVVPPPRLPDVELAGPRGPPAA